MRAWQLETIGPIRREVPPLRKVELPAPVPGPGQLLLRISACGVCHTELDEIEGRTPPPRLPTILGHQIVGRVVGVGASAEPPLEQRVGVAWIYSACGKCAACAAGNENLCPDFRATGRDAPGGYAEYVCVPQESAYPLPACFSDVEAAPLLCAGAIGYRSLRLTRIKDGEPLGLMGFGASAHLVLQLSRYLFPRSPIYVFARQETERAFALDLGAVWASGIQDVPPEPLRAIIDTTPAWTPVLFALRRLSPGGRLVINAIRKEEQDKSALLQLDYASDIWLEKEIQSVANITRRDVREFLQYAAQMRLQPEVRTYEFDQANEALMDLKWNRIAGAKVLRVTQD
jgi:propanol-preferring alcohol dehydrogenase